MEPFHLFARYWSFDTILLQFQFRCTRKYNVYFTSRADGRDSQNTDPSVDSSRDESGEISESEYLRHHVASAGYSNPHLGPPQPS